MELPVGASEDRLVGSLDVERALTEGVKAFEPGLLAAAHRGVLYVDEVNLLHDHLVDLLLDAAALGTCYVERESVSVRHAARFLLVGTMNPEEGELRPQLLDRFGLTVEVKASRDPAERAEVVRRRLAFDLDPGAFAARWAGEEAALARRIAAARARVAEVRLPDARLRQIATVCAAFEVDGLRADLVTANAAIAHAAWQGRDRVTTEDVRAAARLSLPHRRRRDPFDAPGLDEALLEELLERTSGDDDDPDGPDGGPDRPSGPDGPDRASDRTAGRRTLPRLTAGGARLPGPTARGARLPGLTAAGAMGRAARRAMIAGTAPDRTTARMTGGESVPAASRTTADGPDPARRTGRGTAPAESRPAAARQRERPASGGGRRLGRGASGRRGREERGRGGPRRGGWSAGGRGGAAVPGAVAGGAGDR
ncbi:ATP-binding protein [Nonomuraea thailandensis]